MNNPPTTDAELMNRLLTGAPSPAECIIAAARIEQLRAALDRAEADRVAAVVAEREAAAKLAENFGTMQHVAHSIASGAFPEQTDIRDAIAAAIRARGGAA